MSNFFNSFRNLFQYKEPNSYNFVLCDTNNQQTPTSGTITDKVFSSCEENLTFIKDKYCTLINSDIKIREFYLNIQNKQYKAFLFYIDGMIDADAISQFVLNPLMLKNRTNTSTTTDQIKSSSNKVTVVRPFDIQSYIMDSLIPQNDVSTSDEFASIFSQVNMGVSALFVDTVSTVFLIDAKGFEKRSIPVPENELVIRGSQEGFIESFRTNTSLIRRLVNNENLVIETTSVGKINKNKCCICYMKNIANPDLVAEVNYRISNIEIDSITSSGELEQLITDSSFGLPQMISTERPDRVANYLLDGRVAIIVNGSPYVLVAPGVFTDFLSTSEDKNIQYQFSNLLKFIRIISLIITLTLPGFYIAVTTFHQEIIPTELLFAIVASRNAIPFPIIFEILLMDISFELIRESGIRVPSSLGQTIGIVGGLILSDAAVSANIVSPILIIVVAITGLTSFAIPDYSLSFHIRIARFIYVFAGYFAGFLGLSLILFLHLGILAATNSFGVSYLSPYAPFTVNNSDSYFLSPIWKRETRDSFLDTKRKNKEEHISMRWKFGGQK